MCTVMCSSCMYTRSSWWSGCVSCWCNSPWCCLHWEECYLRQHWGSCPANQIGCNTTWHGTRRLEDCASPVWGESSVPVHGILTCLLNNGEFSSTSLLCLGAFSSSSSSHNQIAGYTLPYDSEEELRLRLSQIAPHLVTCGDLQPANYFALAHKMLKVFMNVVI